MRKKHLYEYPRKTWSLERNVRPGSIRWVCAAKLFIFKWNCQIGPWPKSIPFFALSRTLDTRIPGSGILYSSFGNLSYSMKLLFPLRNPTKLKMEYFGANTIGICNSILCAIDCSRYSGSSEYPPFAILMQLADLYSHFSKGIFSYGSLKLSLNPRHSRGFSLYKKNGVTSFLSRHHGADNRTWTCMSLRSLEPESNASANSAISAYLFFLGISSAWLLYRNRICLSTPNSKKLSSFLS